MKYANLGELRLLQGALPDEITRSEWKTWVTEQAVVLGSDPARYIGPHFMTDFASIPRAVRWLFDPNGAPWQRAAVLHDYLYSSTHSSRREADRQYLKQALADGTSKAAAYLQYAALVVGGWAAYRSNQRKLEELGSRWRFLP